MSDPKDKDHCACGCGRLLKQKILKLGYRYVFRCYYNLKRGKNAYEELRVRRIDKRQAKRWSRRHASK